jgi:hypothetical protein
MLKYFNSNRQFLLKRLICKNKSVLPPHFQAIKNIPEIIKLKAKDALNSKFEITTQCLHSADLNANILKILMCIAIYDHNNELFNTLLKLNVNLKVKIKGVMVANNRKHKVRRYPDPIKLRRECFSYPLLIAIEANNLYTLQTILVYYTDEKLPNDIYKDVGCRGNINLLNIFLKHRTLNKIDYEEILYAASSYAKNNMLEYMFNKQPELLKLHGASCMVKAAQYGNFQTVQYMQSKGIHAFSRIHNRHLNTPIEYIVHRFCMYYRGDKENNIIKSLMFDKNLFLHKNTLTALIKLLKKYNKYPDIYNDNNIQIFKRTIRQLLTIFYDSNLNSSTGNRFNINKAQYNQMLDLSCANRSYIPLFGSCLNRIFQSTLVKQEHKKITKQTDVIQEILFNKLKSTDIIKHCLIPYLDSPLSEFLENRMPNYKPVKT